MVYRLRAHPTMYAGTLFRSRLEARWAAFFDLAGWRWEYEPLDLQGWTPDFLVTFPCGHSECGPTHSLLVEVKPYTTLAEFEGHPCLKYPYGRHGTDRIPADASAAFGNNPDVTWWEMAHGAGGGEESVTQYWIDGDPWALWAEAGNRTRYRPPVPGPHPPASAARQPGVWHRARFMGCAPVPGSEPAVRWSFRISEGPLVGRYFHERTMAEVEIPSRAAELLEGLVGKPLAPGTSIETSDFTGRFYLLEVAGDLLTFRRLRPAP